MVITLPRGMTGELSATIRYEGPLRAPFPAGEQVAVLEVTAPGMAHATIPLFTAEEVASAGPLDRIFNAFAGLFA